MPSGRQKKLGLGSRQAANSVSRQVSVTRALCGWLLRKCRLVERAAGQGGLVVVLFGHSQGGLSWEVVAGEQSTVYGPSGVAKTGDGEDTTGGVGYCYIPQANASGLLQYQSAAAATAEGGGSAAANRRLARARPGSRVRAGVQDALALPLRPVLVRVPREPMDS